MWCCVLGNADSKKANEKIEIELEKAKQQQAHHVKLLLLGNLFASICEMAVDIDFFFGNEGAGESGKRFFLIWLDDFLG